MALHFETYGADTRGLRDLSRGRTLGILIALALLLAGVLIQVHALTILAVKKDSVLLIRLIHPKDCFSYRSIHSVELSPVQDLYRVGDDYGITLYETRFRSSNVGLPYAAFGKEKFMPYGDGYRITNMNRKIPQLLIWANDRYDTTLSMGSEKWPLYTFAGNTLVRIGIDHLSLFKFIFLWICS
jgi:hypothetical protein